MFVNKKSRNFKIVLVLLIEIVVHPKQIAIISIEILRLKRLIQSLFSSFGIKNY